MLAYQVETFVGRCSSCKAFRNTLQWYIEEKQSCCDRCLQIFKNQNKISEFHYFKKNNCTEVECLSDLDTELKEKRVPKPKKEKPVKLKREKVKKEKVKKERRNDSKLRSEILAFVTSSEQPMTIEELNSRHCSSIWYQIKILEKEGSISIKKKRNLYIIDKKREYLLDEYIDSDEAIAGRKRLYERKLAAQTIELQNKMMSFVKNSERPITAQELFEYLGIDPDNSWVYHNLSRMKEDKLIIYSEQYPRYFVDIKRRELLSNVQAEYGNNATRKELIRILEEADHTLTLDQLETITGLSRETVRVYLKHFDSTNLVSRFSISNKDQFYYALNTNQLAIAELDKFKKSSFDFQVIESLKQGKKTRSQILDAIGKDKRSSNHMRQVHRILTRHIENGKVRSEQRKFIYYEVVG